MKGTEEQLEVIASRLDEISLLIGLLILTVADLKPGATQHSLEELGAEIKRVRDGKR